MKIYQNLFFYYKNIKIDLYFIIKINLRLYNYNIIKMDELELDFSKLSVSITKKLSSSEKSEGGIFFTPSSIIEKSIDVLKEQKDLNIINILEPSCGSCEFIIRLNNYFKNTNITGIEYNNTIYNDIKNIKFNNINNNKIELIKNDFLIWNSKIKYDLIIGNPPYFVIKKNSINKNYYKYFDGRPNIYIIFIIHSIFMLNNNGILLFVLPVNFINCLYYNELRKYIYSNYKIINIIDCKDDQYLETEQDTIIFVIQKIETKKEDKMNLSKDSEYKDSKDKELFSETLVKEDSDKNIYFKKINKKFILEINDYIIFNTEKNINRLKELYKGSITLSSLNCDVNVGTVVWNQVKNILKDNPKYTRLIYSSEIKDKELIIKKYSNIDKKNYIDKKGIKEPVLVLNRGYGKGKYKLDYCLINVDYEYLIENHLICIRSNENIENKSLLKLYNKIIKSFDDERTSEFINLYFGNSAINTTELKYILPIYTID